MSDRLIIGVLGNKNSGKSLTWNTLFGKTVITGKGERQLWLSKTEWISVFLISGSPEERETYVGDIIGNASPQIVLCSMQYREDVTKTIDYFAKNNYDFLFHWLNPGFNDGIKNEDSIQLISHILNYNSLVGIRDGKVDPGERVDEIKEFLRGWANTHDLLHSTN
jgi:septin family protein